jgi:hypothetical protein
MMRVALVRQEQERQKHESKNRVLQKFALG